MSWEAKIPTARQTGDYVQAVISGGVIGLCRQLSGEEGRSSQKPRLLARLLDEGQSIIKTPQSDVACWAESRLGPFSPGISSAYVDASLLTRSKSSQFYLAYVDIDASLLNRSKPSQFYLPYVDASLLTHSKPCQFYLFYFYLFIYLLTYWFTFRYTQGILQSTITGSSWKARASISTWQEYLNACHKISVNFDFTVTPTHPPQKKKKKKKSGMCLISSQLFLQTEADTKLKSVAFFFFSVAKTSVPEFRSTFLF